MNPFDIMKNMKDLQKNVDAMKSQLETTFATGNAGAGMVEITINGKYNITDIKIDKAIVDPEDVETLQVLIAAAFNSASENLQRKLQEEGSKMAGSLGDLGNLFGQN
ncbi:MAG: YbaB/EbfC family nucleoid-associated protein [Pleomorphochaeta sp.]